MSWDFRYSSKLPPIKVLPTPDESNAVIRHLYQDHGSRSHRSFTKLSPEVLLQLHELYHKPSTVKGIFTPQPKKFRNFRGMGERYDGTRHQHIRQEGINEDSFPFSEWDQYRKGLRVAKGFGIKEQQYEDAVWKYGFDHDEVMEAFKRFNRLNYYTKARIRGNATHEQVMDAANRGIDDQWYAQQRTNKSGKFHSAVIAKAFREGKTSVAPNAYPVSDERPPQPCFDCGREAKHTVFYSPSWQSTPRKPRPACDKHAMEYAATPYYTVVEGFNG